jgi:hypothetical protein
MDAHQEQKSVDNECDQNLQEYMFLFKGQPLRTNKLNSKVQMKYRIERKSRCCDQTELQALDPLNHFDTCKYMHIEIMPTLVGEHQQRPFLDPKMLIPNFNIDNVIEQKKYYTVPRKSRY